MMETQSVAGVACSDLNQAMSRIDGAALARLEQAIADAKAVFVFGAGRSLLMLKAFCDAPDAYRPEGACCRRCGHACAAKRRPAVTGECIG